jgi:hypothetical protein
LNVTDQSMAPAALAGFLANHIDAPLGKLAETIRSACRRGAGTWYDPAEDARARRWLASTEVEVQFLGVHARGAEPLDAARNWLRAAGYVALIDEAYAAVATP